MIQTKGDYKDYRRMDDARYVKSKYLARIIKHNGEKVGV